MKKLLSLLVITAIIGIISCKKEAAIKPAANTQTVISPQKVSAKVYDYQKAILEKRSAGRVNLAK